MVEEKHFAEFIATAHETGKRNLTRCSSGNLSLRVGEYVLISETGSWLSNLRKDQISICKLNTGKCVNGIKPSVESSFHLAIMRNRPDVNVVLHCQSIYATTIACMKNKPSNFNVTAEIACYCGSKIAVVNYYRPGSSELANAVTEAMNNHNSVLLEKHGQVFVAKDFNQAIERAEFFEMACKIIINSRMQYNTLTNDEISDLDRNLTRKTDTDTD
jgi:ribulose-5-phosphate 4-epimerase/fuculose-1-phosphate aldolase